MTAPDERLVDTAFGPVHVATRAGDSEPVLAVHGVSSTSRLWLWLHDAAPWATLIAPDLAGRGRSPVAAGAASSPAVHADHLAALLDALGLDAVAVVGMSMGGFVATELAARHGDRVRTLTLVDGGLPLPEPAGDAPSRDAVTAAVRRQYDAPTDWPDLASYVAHYCGTAAPLLDPDDPRVATMLAHELPRGRAGGVVRRDLDTVVADAVSVFTSGDAEGALAASAVPTRLVHAEWGVGAGTPPMYPVDHVARLVAATPSLVSAQLVPGVDHAAIAMSDPGAEAVAAALALSLGRG